MDWIIKNNYFLRNKLRPNHYVKLISNDLRKFKSYTFYLRGSLIEDKPIHSNADIDLFLIHEENHIKNATAKEITDILSHFNRFIDLHIFNYKFLDYNLPNKLLLHTRSIHVCGEKLKLQPVELNYELIIQHWYAYNPGFAPDIMFSSVRSRVSALKNLTRCFGLINLIENDSFTRDIDECLLYAKKKNNAIYNILSHNWSIVDYQVPLFLKEIKEYLIDYQKAFESKNLVKANLC